MLVEIDLTDPTTPVEVAELALDGTVLGISFSNQHVFVTMADAGLAVIDASASGTLVQVGSIDTPGSPNDVTVSGAYAFVADRSAGLTILSDCSMNLFFDDFESGDSTRWSSVVPD